jgi:hypothetical protein
VRHGIDQRVTFRQSLRIARATLAMAALTVKQSSQERCPQGLEGLNRGWKAP